MHQKIRKQIPMAYRSISQIEDDRIFEFGSIWKLKDTLINIPNADRLNKRTYHFSRCVIIVDNSKDNNNKDSLIIAVAPISSKIKCKRKFDIDLDKINDGVLEDSIVMLDYVQPVLKKDLYKCVGEISDDKKYDLLDSIMVKIGIKAKEEVAADDDTKENKNKE